VKVARDLIGARLVRTLAEGERLTARIVETEAYVGDDPACHAFTTAKKPNPNRRGAALYGAPGTAYVYFNYGCHWMLNVVTEPLGTAGAVLIRAVEPLEGIERMSELRPGVNEVELTNGPGKLTRALAIDSRLHGTMLTEGELHFAAAPPGEVTEVGVTTRIGITKGVDRPWRFVAVGNRFVSKGRPAGGGAAGGRC
jgi:DNA-3-methyladenine glycosylase